MSEVWALRGLGWRWWPGRWRPRWSCWWHSFARLILLVLLLGLATHRALLAGVGVGHHCAHRGHHLRDAYSRTRSFFIAAGRRPLISAATSTIGRQRPLAFYPLSYAASAVAGTLDAAVDLVAKQREEAGDASAAASFLAAAAAAGLVVVLVRRSVRLDGLLRCRLPGRGGGELADGGRLAGNDEFWRRLPPEDGLGDTTAQRTFAQTVHVQDGLAKTGQTLGHAHTRARFW